MPWLTNGNIARFLEFYNFLQVPLQQDAPGARFRRGVGLSFPCSKISSGGLFHYGIRLDARLLRIYYKNKKW